MHEPGEVASIECGLRLPQLLLIIVIHVVGVRTLAEQLLHSQHIFLILPHTCDVEQVQNLFVAGLASKGAQKALDIPEHVKAALTSSVLLKDRHMLNVVAYGRVEKFHVQVAHGFANFCWFYFLKLVSDSGLTSERIPLIVVTLPNALTICLDHIGDQVKDDLFEEINRVTIILCGSIS